MRVDRERYVLIGATIVAAALVVSAAAVAGFVPFRSGSSTPSTQSAENVTVRPAGANESTRIIRHQRPESVSGSAANLQRAGLELARSLGVRLNVSAQELAEQDYSAAEAELGAEYQRDVIRLTEIAEATENVSDDQIAAAYRAAGESQREVANDAKRFRELYNEYQRARLNQNETEARQVAQQLAAEFQDLNATAANLSSAYASLETVNESVAERAQRKINQSLRQAQQLAENAREATYIETNLSVSARQPNASPTRPFVLQGQLRTAEAGTPLSNRTIVVGAGGHTTSAETNRTGHFTIRHRPTLLKRGERAVTVRYVPNETAGYLGATATADVNITQQPATLHIDSAPQTVTKVRPGRVTGRVLVENSGVSGVPVVVIIDGQQLDTTRTNTTGSFSLTIAPPLNRAPGPISAVVKVDTTTEAVGPTRQSLNATVTEIPVNLSVEASRIRPRTLRIQGRLETVTTQPLTDRTVIISVADQTVGWLRTDADGRFAGNFTLQAEQFGGSIGPDVTVTASFGDQGTHLQSARNTATATLPAFSPPGLFGYGIAPATWALLIGALLILGGGAVFTRWRTGPDKSVNESPLDVESSDTDPAPPDTDAPDPEAALVSAQSVAPDDPQTAARRGYMAVRTQFAGRFGIPNHDSMTHWEFYRAFQNQADNLSSDTISHFERLTQLYEQAVYANRTPSDDTLTEVLIFFVESDTDR